MFGDLPDKTLKAVHRTAFQAESEHAVVAIGVHVRFLNPITTSFCPTFHLYVTIGTDLRRSPLSSLFVLP